MIKPGGVEIVRTLTCFDVDEINWQICGIAAAKIERRDR
jgi:hypothetical protein